MSKKINPVLKPGDRIVLIEMVGETSISYGDRGTYIGEVGEMSYKQRKVEWDNGSRLFLLDEDKWMLESDFDEILDKKRKRNIKEAEMKEFGNDAYLLKHFDMLFLKKYLKKLQESSVVNMLAASPYLYMGKERLAHEHKYNDTNEAFDDVVDMADKAQSVMVNGVISIIEDEGKEVTVEKINSYLRRYSSKIISFYSRYY